MEQIDHLPSSSQRRLTIDTEDAWRPAERRLVAAAAAARRAGRPQPPRAATPVVDLDRAVEVGRRVARGAAAAAARPVHLVDLPQTRVDAAVAVAVARVRVAAGLLRDHAAAARLVPAVLRAPRRRVDVHRAAADRAVVVLCSCIIPPK